MKDIILKLLEGKTITNDQLNELKIIEKEENEYILLKCKHENNDIIVPTEYASIQADKFFPNSTSLLYNNIFLVLINTCTINRKKLESNIIEYLRLFRYKGGVSREFSNIIEITDYFLQACAAIEIGSKYDYNLRAYYFEDYVKEYIVSMITKEIPACKTCSKELLKLADYDNKHNTEYFNELYVYIDNKMNAVQTAKKLFMHRNTFLTHMENINKIIDIDLEDPNERLYIHLSFKLLTSETPYFQSQTNMNN
jgi:sugar diacid utilization regulator